MKRFQYQSYADVGAINLANLFIRYEDDKYDVTFRYDERRSGAPFRRGHNKDFQNPDSPFYGKDNLNETAFVLARNQYGRIIWNERKLDCDDGIWYYQLHINNLYYLPDKTYAKDIFVQNEPDYVYKQLASLF